MNEILEKISSYNIFNYLLPGTLFSFSAQITTSYKFEQDDLLIGLFLYYFIGLVISRVGSILVEPLFKKIRLVEFSKYEDYLKAVKLDGQIETLSESNNMFRSLISMFACLLVLISYEKLEICYSQVAEFTPYLIIGFLILLFAISYRKQTKYIVKRIEAANLSDD